MKRILTLLVCMLCLLPAASAAEGYTAIEKQVYRDKTLSGFLSQIVGMLSGYEYKMSGERYAVGMPDAWFEFCNGPYAGNTAYLTHADKHVPNSEGGIYEVWIDDDFGVDIFNQYILADMFAKDGAVNARAVSDGWLRYGIWDMGGGQRQVGAYGLISRQYYLPQFAGNGEFGNRYSYLSEPYIAADTLGMNAGGMPETAAALAGTFAEVTGDRDNVAWAKLFAAMLSMAYFEDDIPALIRESARVFPEGSYSASLIDEIFALHAKYPNDWRAAFTAFEAAHYTGGITTGANTTVNCGFALLTLLYGGGDYMETAKIGSLAGYDCETSCGIALSVLGIMGGTAVLPEAVNTRIWQDGRGIIVNLPVPGTTSGTNMHADNLDARMAIADIAEKYVLNFESVLTANGGYADEEYYYIPTEVLRGYKTVPIINGGFERGSLDGFTAKGNAVLTNVTTFGKYAAKLTGDTELYTTVQGLTVGKTYTLTAFIHATDRSAAYLFARAGESGVCTAVFQTEGAAENAAYKSVRRSLVFTATATEMEIGVRFAPDSNAILQYAAVDGFTLLETTETAAGRVILENEKADGVYTMLRTVVQADKAGEHLLKLTYTNKNAAVDARIIVNGKGYAAAALSKTGIVQNDLTAADCVYIPILLREGHNTVTLSFGGYTVGITEATLVDVEYK